MGKIWPLQDAKAKLSQLIRAAAKEPQTITRHGEEVGVLLSPQEYQRLMKAVGSEGHQGPAPVVDGGAESEFGDSEA